MEDINSFRGDYACFSNFFMRDINIFDHIFACGEGAFQSQKDLTRVEEFLLLTPTKAKWHGKRVSLREDWEEIKDSIMLEVIRAKFKQHPDLAEILMKTGDAPLIEGNSWHDNYWGQCMCSRCTHKVGQNKLGITLMKVREELKLEV